MAFLRYNKAVIFIILFKDGHLEKTQCLLYDKNNSEPKRDCLIWPQTTKIIRMR